MAATFLPLVVGAVVSAEEAEHDIPMAPVWYAVIAFALFLVGLGVLWTFRKSYAKVPQRPSAHGGHGAPGGHGGHGDPGAHH